MRGLWSKVFLLVLVVVIVWVLVAPDFDLELGSLRFSKIARLFWTAVMTALVALILQAVRQLTPIQSPDEPPAPTFPLLDLVCARLC